MPPNKETKCCEKCYHDIENGVVFTLFQCQDCSCHMTFNKETKECKCGCEGNNKDFNPEKMWNRNCMYYPKDKETKEEELREIYRNYNGHTFSDDQIDFLLIQRFQELSKLKEKIKKLGQNADGTFPVGFWDDIYALFKEVEK